MLGSKFKGELDMSSASIGSHLLMEQAEFIDVNLVAARVGDWLSMRGSKFKKCELNMSSASIGSHPFLSGKAEFAELANLSKLDLTGAKIKGELRLGSSADENINKSMLQNTSVGILQNTTTCQDKLEWEFEGFTYDRLGEFDYDERKSSWFIDWLGKDMSYSPQPYRYLAGVLRTAGHEDIADDILFASREREREASNWLEAKWWKLGALKIFIGYGYGWGSFRTALSWIAWFVVLGTLILHLARERNKHSIISRLLDSACYSLDMLLPIIRLRERHYTDVDLTTWARYYFYFHQAMGYVLVFFVIAGLSGLTE